MKYRFDLRNDLAVQAAKQLDAKIIEAVRAAFDNGMDFVRSVDITFQPNPVTPWLGGTGRYQQTIAYTAGPIDPNQATPADMIRYERPTTWRRGQALPR